MSPGQSLWSSVNILLVLLRLRGARESSIKWVTLILPWGCPGSLSKGWSRWTFWNTDTVKETTRRTVDAGTGWGRSVPWEKQGPWPPRTPSCNPDTSVSLSRLSSYGFCFWGKKQKNKKTQAFKPMLTSKWGAAFADPGISSVKESFLERKSILCYHQQNFSVSRS